MFERQFNGNEFVIEGVVVGTPVHDTLAGEGTPMLRISVKVNSPYWHRQKKHMVSRYDTLPATLFGDLADRVADIKEGDAVKLAGSLRVLNEPEAGPTAIRIVLNVRSAQLAKRAVQ